MTDLPEHGRLEEHSLPRLLVDMLRARFTGRFELRRERVEKGFVFHDGVPISAESNLASESLGVQLMDGGLISRGDYNAVVARVEKAGCKEGKALLALRLIEPKALFLALKEQVRARLVDCFSWAQGEFAIDSSVSAPADTQPFRADMVALLQEGIATHWRADRILAELEPRMAKYPSRSARLSAILGRLGGDDALDAFVSSIDGKETLWRALQLAATPGAIAGAWVLDAMGGLTYRDRPEGADEDQAEIDLQLVVSAGDPSDSFSELQFAEPIPGDEPKAGGRAAKAADEEESPLRAEIDEKYEHLASFDFYQLLDVPAAAEPEAIKAAYLRAAKTYHPDALARAMLSDDAIERASKVFGAIGKAYGTLSNPQRRAEYDRRDSGEDDADAGRLANAEALYRKGEILLRQGNFRGALEFLEPAVELWPEEADYQSALGWTLYKKMPSEPEAAKECLEHAAQLSNDDAVVLFRLSVVLGSLGETVASANLLERARRMDPKVES